MFYPIRNQNRASEQQMDSRAKFDITIPSSSLISGAMFKQQLDNISQRLDKYITDQNLPDKDISELRKNIASAIVTAVFEQYPDTGEDKPHQFDGSNLFGSRQVKNELLKIALTHDIFKPRTYTSAYNWFNTAATIFSNVKNSEIPAFRSVSQNIIYEAWHANYTLMNSTASAKYQVEDYTRSDNRPGSSS